jgi:HEPN domain-containing protein
MNDRVEYWMEISDYDMETAKSMLDTGRYIYVGFMCHQAIEKILKAYWQLVKNKIPPKTHNLLYLSSETSIDKYFSIGQNNLIDELRPLNIETRYPEYKDAINKKMTREESERIYMETKDFHLWIKQKLSTKRENI